MHATDVLHFDFPYFRDDAHRRHPRLRVPRKGVPNHAAGDALLDDVLRRLRQALDHPGVGRNPGAAQVLRRQALQRLARFDPAVVLPEDLHRLQTLPGPPDAGEHLRPGLSGHHFESDTGQCGDHRGVRHHSGDPAHLRHDLLVFAVPDDRVACGLPANTSFNHNLS